MIDKVQNHHREKKAYIYLRQSSMRQVLHNQESTERQYALKDKALKLGWEPHQIIVIDSDLGQSGAQMHYRDGFKKLVAEVCMEQAGAVFALEASRLSRSCADWHKLLGLCAFTSTLIVDDDGVYDPADFNDQLLLGLKGTMSQAELHVMRGRLQKAKENKAQRGELRFPLPVGFCYENDDIILDVDDEVRGAVHLLFSTFKKIGTAQGVAREFTKNNLKFPKRAYGGVWRGKLIWDDLTTSRVLGVLKNPSYAGAYVFGRYKYVKHISPEGEVFSKVKQLPLEKWPVHIQEHHQGYISWEEFLQNQETLQKNRTNEPESILSSALREGSAILQGLLMCSRCGHKISPRYKGENGLYPMYECNKAKKNGTGTHCISFRADRVDAAVVQRVLEVLNQDQLEIALAALHELETRDKALDKQWSMRLERAEYEAQLAQRRYEQVDPANRLVASNLEKAWNAALVNVEQIKEQREQNQQRQSLTVTPEQKKRILSLAQDLPKLWNASSTRAEDRKRILHLLINDITVEKTDNQLTLHLRWQGGAIEDLKVTLLPRYSDQVRYSEDFVSRIRELAQEFSDEEIAQQLNAEGKPSAKKKPFTRKAIAWIRHKHKIPFYRSQQKRSDELTIDEMMEKFNVSRHVVYYWIERSIVRSRKLGLEGQWWITLTHEEEQELQKRARKAEARGKTLKERASTMC
jgi:DNA invertase Pin-like site-specific DNA recombinase